jgi:hypothetical protein
LEDGGDGFGAAAGGGFCAVVRSAPSAGWQP